VHALDRAEDAARPAQGEQRSCDAHPERDRQHDQQRHLLGGAERRLEKTDIQHAHALAAAVVHRLIGRHVPVIDDEGGLEPGQAALQHVAAHLVRGARAERARALEQAHVGGDAHVIDKQRRRPRAAFGQAACAIDDGVERIDEAQVTVEQHAALEHADQIAGRVMHRRGRMHDQPTRLFGARIGAGTLGGDQGQARAFAQRGRDGGERRGREALDRAPAAAAHRPLHHRPVGARRCVRHAGR